MLGCGTGMLAHERAPTPARARSCDAPWARSMVEVQAPGVLEDGTKAGNRQYTHHTQKRIAQYTLERLADACTDHAYSHGPVVQVQANALGISHTVAQLQTISTQVGQRVRNSLLPTTSGEVMTSMHTMRRDECSSKDATVQSCLCTLLYSVLCTEQLASH